MKKEVMSTERLMASLAIPDLTDSHIGLHAINIVVKKVQEGLKKVYSGIPIEEIRTNPEVTIKENFDNLLFPIDNAGRSSRYTRYVTPNTVLRTHWQVPHILDTDSQI